MGRLVGTGLIAAAVVLSTGVPARAQALSFAEEPTTVTASGGAFALNLSRLQFDLPQTTGETEERTNARSATQAPVPVAFVYSDAYQTRNKIHHVASYATLPLFAAEVYIGQRMFNNPANATSGMRHLHGTIAVAITGLFGVNSVTGVWNLIDGRKDPHGLMLRTIHGVLMLVGNAGFVATALDRPNGRTAAGLSIYDQKKNQHLALAYASISVATVGYLMMLFR
jgi:hypothetical protein